MKTNKWIYWITTVLLSIQMMATGIGDIIQAEPIVQSITALGFPIYLLPLFGVLKILGILTILFIKITYLKTGAYAGFLFYGIGAVYSHLAHGDAFTMAMPAFFILLLVLASFLSWLNKTPSTKNDVS